VGMAAKRSKSARASTVLMATQRAENTSNKTKTVDLDSGPGTRAWSDELTETQIQLVIKERSQSMPNGEPLTLSVCAAQAAARHAIARGKAAWARGENYTVLQLNPDFRAYLAKHGLEVEVRDDILRRVDQAIHDVAKTRSVGAQQARMEALGILASAYERYCVNHEAMAEAREKERELARQARVDQATEAQISE
jgi:hypothetical protein